MGLGVCCISSRCSHPISSATRRPLPHDCVSCFFNGRHTSHATRNRSCGVLGRATAFGCLAGLSRFDMRRFLDSFVKQITSASINYSGRLISCAVYLCSNYMDTYLPAANAATLCIDGDGPDFLDWHRLTGVPGDKYVRATV